MFSYCGELVAHRRKHGLTDDILSALLEAEVDGEKLNRDQLNEFFLLLAIAGNETTRNTLSHGILALAQHPEQQALLARDPDAVKPAVEELLRWSTPVMHFLAPRPVTSKSAEQIPAGDWVLLALPVGQPRRAGVRAGRGVRRHPSRRRTCGIRGGGGVHFCLGAQLARLELRVMLEELYAKVPDLTVTGPPDRLRSSFFHGIKRLPCSTG